MKSRKIKKRWLIVDQIRYLYSVTEYTDDIQINLYVTKYPLVKLHLSYPESWGIDVFRPITIKILIRYVREHYINEGTTTELWLFQEKELFARYLEYFFADDEAVDKEHYLTHISKYPHQKQSHDTAR